MADLVSVSTLLTLSRDIAGLHGQSYYDNDRMTRALNRHAKVYWPELTEGRDGRGRQRRTVTATANQESLALPDDTLDLLRFDRPVSGTESDYATAERVELPVWPDAEDYDSGRPGIYLIRGDNLLLRPVPTVAEVCRFEIRTIAPKLVELTDEIECVAGYEYVLAWGAAMDLTTDLQKRSMFSGLYAQELARVRRDRGKRDRAPDRVRYHDRSRRAVRRRGSGEPS